MKQPKGLCFGILIMTLLACSDQSNTESLFSLVPTDYSNVDFNNVIIDNDSLNILKYEYIYNGGGVALADFDNDGLSDIFFSGNIVSNKLYRNQGDFVFEDITQSSGVAAKNSWCSGIAIVDINSDGLKDIYVCANTKKNGSDRKNLLFINKTIENGPISFNEEAEAYGIADSSYSTNSAFFDYDNDGDLDLFIINNHLNQGHKAVVYSYKADELVWDRVDRLYRNDWSDELGHPFYTDVTKEAGINKEGYSLGLNICDIDQDGWKDIYITNDFISNDVLYINNGDGTFKDRSRDYLKHTSHSAMGNDIADINNDGLMDIVAVDMLPESNYRFKTMMQSSNYARYVYNETYDYSQQYIRNTLQLNRGKLTENGMIFSDISMMAGVESTDWSWTPLLADFDLDGYRDLIITNGFPKDITDRDFINYRSDVGAYLSHSEVIQKIPEVKLPNYAYRNTGELKFEDVTHEWGMAISSFSNGAVYGDLDNDGDLDLVINNINDPAFIYKNNSSNKNSVSIRLKGEDNNIAALGTIIEYKSENISGIYEHSLSRGYLSSVDEKIIIGLGEDTIVDLKIKWPNDRVSVIKDLKTGENLLLSIENSSESTKKIKGMDVEYLFEKTDFVSDEIQEEIDHIDYNIEPLLLHKFSQNGPGVSVGDVNGDNRDDYYITGSYTKHGSLYIQNNNGSFSKSDMLPVNNIVEEQSSLFFDVDNDGDQDLYITSGSNHFESDHELYKDILLINENGKYKNVSESLDLPKGATSCVRAADFDKDGDLDLFVGGQLLSGNYPLPVSSYLLINNSTSDEVKLEIANSEYAPELTELGMISDGLWTDYNNDGWQDLILAGKWMPVTFFKNEKGILKKDDQSEIDDQRGWWNSIVAADFDSDGDMDYVVGNYGKNSIIQASDEYPFEIYANDFDDNGSLDAIPFGYYKDLNGKLEQYPFHERSDLNKEMNHIKKAFTSNHKFGLASIDSILSKEEQQSAYHLKATNFSSSYIDNKGNGNFGMSPLPVEAQMAPLYGMKTEDYDSDGHMDLLVVGNDFGAMPWIGRMDAFNGIYFKGNGDGTFTPTSVSESGFYVPKDAKALVDICINNRKSLIISQNKDRLLAYRINNEMKYFTPDHDDARISYFIQDVKKVVEIHHGSGYLGQSTRKLSIPTIVEEIVVTKYDGSSRVIEFKN